MTRLVWCPATARRRTWLDDRRTAFEYAARRLADCSDDLGLAPADFGAVWANMRRGHRLGELRVLPGLAEAFADWLEEARR